MFDKHMFDYYFESDKDEWLVTTLASLDHKLNLLITGLRDHLPAAAQKVGASCLDITALNKYLRRTAADYLSGTGPLGSHILGHIRLHDKLFAQPLPAPFEYGWISGYEKAFIHKHVASNHESVSKLVHELSEEIKYASLIGKRSQVYEINADSNELLGLRAKYVRAHPSGYVTFLYMHPYERVIFDWENLVVPQLFEKLKEEFWKQNPDVTDESIKTLEDQAIERFRKILGILGIEHHEKAMTSIACDKYRQKSVVQIHTHVDESISDNVSYLEDAGIYGYLNADTETQYMPKMLKYRHLLEINRAFTDFLVSTAAGVGGLNLMLKEKGYRLNVIHVDDRAIVPDKAMFISRGPVMHARKNDDEQSSWW